MYRCFSDLYLEDAEIGNNREEADYGNRETELPETLNSKYSGSVKGKKKDISLLTSWTAIIQTDFLANEFNAIILGNPAPPGRLLYAPSLYVPPECAPCRPMAPKGGYRPTPPAFRLRSQGNPRWPSRFSGQFARP